MAVSLAPTRLQRMEHYVQSYAVPLAAGISLDDVLEPKFWAHVGKLLHQFDRITFLPEDGSWIADAVVVSAGAGFAKLKVLAEWDLTSGDELASEVVGLAADDAFTVKWGGPANKWSVIRNSDAELLKKGFASKEEADLWKRDHVKAIA